MLMNEVRSEYFMTESICSHCGGLGAEKASLAFWSEEEWSLVRWPEYVREFFFRLCCVDCEAKVAGSILAHYIIFN